MEIAENQGVFSSSEKFEINDVEFHQIRIDGNRLMAAGPEWTKFELLLSFIGAAWMERWRRFGLGMLAAGFFVFFFGVVLISSPFGFMMMGIGGVLMVLWLFMKREAVMLYTPSEKFKIEGASDFIQRVWAEISKAQRARQI